MRPHTVHTGFNLSSIFCLNPGIGAGAVILRIQRAVAEKAVDMIRVMAGIEPAVMIFKIPEAISVAIFVWHVL